MYKSFSFQKWGFYIYIFIIFFDYVFPEQNPIKTQQDIFHFSKEHTMSDSDDYAPIIGSIGTIVHSKPPAQQIYDYDVAFSSYLAILKMYKGKGFIVYNLIGFFLNYIRATCM